MVMLFRVCCAFVEFLMYKLYYRALAVTGSVRLELSHRKA